MILASLLQTAVFLVCVRVVNSATAPVVDLGYAQYQGVVDTKLNITAFRGIRYVTPPTGKHQSSTLPKNLQLSPRKDLYDSKRLLRRPRSLESSRRSMTLRSAIKGCSAHPLPTH
jgi:hypothetical protein